MGEGGGEKERKACFLLSPKRQLLEEVALSHKVAFSLVGPETMGREWNPSSSHKPGRG